MLLVITFAGLTLLLFVAAAVVSFLFGRRYERMRQEFAELRGKATDLCHVCHKPYSMPMTIDGEIHLVSIGSTNSLETVC